MLLSALNAQTRLAELERSSKKRKVGEVFVMNPPDRGGFLWGRVVRTDADAGLGGRRSNLLYIYDVRTSDREVPWGHLSPDRLLIAPVLVNNTPWRRGIVETVAVRPMAQGDVLSEHLFNDPWREVVYNEYGDVVDSIGVPLRERGLGSYRTLDDEIADALGLERAP
jgi:hypothetical protein